MGAINNAFNQALGATAGAALAIKHAKESDFSKSITAEHSALVAKNQAVEAETAANEAKLEEKPTSQSLVDAIVDSWGKDDEYYKARDDHNKDSNKTPYSVVAQKLTEWEASQRAIDELDNKLNGIQAMRQRALDQRAYADKASQIASKAQQKYQSKWGGR